MHYNIAIIQNKTLNPINPPMASHPPNPAQFQPTLTDEKHQTSIMNRAQPKHPSINIDQMILQLPPLGYDRKASKQRYASMRSSLPNGNFEWIDYNAQQEKQDVNKDQPWSCKKKLAVVGFVLIATAAIVCVVLYFMSRKAGSGLHEQSVEPIVPSFLQISGIMNANKVEPLLQPHQATFHLRRGDRRMNKSMILTSFDRA